MVFQKGFTAQRWAKAREFQKLDMEKTGTSKGLREYYKNQNPISENMQKYEVTFDMNITGEGYEFFIPQESFTIYSYGGLDDKDQFEEMTKQAVSSIFKGKATNKIYENTNVRVRGVEDIGNVKYNEIDSNQLLSNNVFSDKIPNVEVKKKKGSNVNTNKYNLNIWI